jgi:hypothetical protein
MMRFPTLLAILALPAVSLAQVPADATSANALVSSYEAWRGAMVRKDAAAWQRNTAAHRQVEVRNRLASEKRAFPAALFDLPAPPPSLDGLKLIHLSLRGATAKAAFFGKINFGIGGEPTENVMVLSFVNSGGWKYDRADFVNLAALPEVRKELAAGNLKYVAETPEFQAGGVVPPTPAVVPRAKYIAKVYVFCPGREVQVQVNQISRHRFANAKEAEVVLGGVKDGPNTITYTAKGLEGGTGKEALAVRVYLMSEIAGTQPLKAYEYQVREGEAVRALGTATFNIDAAAAARLLPAGR